MRSTYHHRKYTYHNVITRGLGRTEVGTAVGPEVETTRQGLTEVSLPPTSLAYSKPPIDPEELQEPYGTSPVASVASVPTVTALASFHPRL